MRRLSNSAALVDNWFDMLPPHQQATVRALHGAVLDAAPQLIPSVKWGNLAYLDGAAQILSISTHKTHAQLQAARVLSAMLPPHGPGDEAAEHPLARPLKCRYSQSVDEGQVARVVRACMQLRYQVDPQQLHQESQAAPQPPGVG
ncbi:DUF1801 domain-containing protein [Azohydromonas lata]|uniref:DUF1801 domain-containing protein n=1 Tax=Azohydromonas lata TaxID=45677 RepID=A0ABU5INE2_9BURK|nr:DUF1801 domain-containing protein [Azohydromonas lata]MDZ5460417.1 DUF1801 domain-containing protein [Azohydromonas lata]